MALYADLSQVGTGDGSLENPFNFSQLVTDSNDNGGIYYLKGNYTGASITLLSINVFNWYAWDPVSFGPWRLNFPDTDYLTISGEMGSLLSGGIIQHNLGLAVSDLKIVFGVNLYNCAVICDGLAGLGDPYEAKGCLFNMAAGSYYGPGATLTDCVILSPDNVNITGGVYYYCAFTCDDPLQASVNCQFNWSAPSMPAWDAAQSSWDVLTIFAGILSPPQDGNPPYIGYNADLWGNYRTGIGTGYMPISSGSLSSFSSSSVFDGEYVNSIVNQNTVIASCVGDDYFDSTSKLGMVFVYYTHEEGRQNKRIVHTYPDFITPVSWSNDSRDGTWLKTKVRVFDLEGAEHTLLRNDIGTWEDIHHNLGVMQLNT